MIDAGRFVELIDDQVKIPFLVQITERCAVADAVARLEATVAEQEATLAEKEATIARLRTALAKASASAGPSETAQSEG